MTVQPTGKSGKIGELENAAIPDHDVAYIMARLDDMLRQALFYEPDVIVLEMERRNGRWDVRTLVDAEIAAVNPIRPTKKG